MEAAQGARPHRGRRLLQERRALLVRIGHGPAMVGGLIAFAASRLPLGLQVREGLDFRLDFLDFRFELRTDFLEFSLRLDAVDGGPLEALLRPSNLGAIARLDPSKPLQLPIGFVLGRNSDTSASPARTTGLGQGSVSGDYHVEHAIGVRVLQRVAVCVNREVDLREVLAVPFALEDELPFLETHPDAFAGDAGHLRRQEDRGFRQDDVDERIAGPDLLALEGRPGSLGSCFARSGRESVDERLAEDAELPLERILEHAVKRAARLLELVLDTHREILPSLVRTAFAERGPLSFNPVELMVWRFHIVFATSPILQRKAPPGRLSGAYGDGVCS